MCDSDSFYKLSRICKHLRRIPLNVFRKMESKISQLNFISSSDEEWAYALKYVWGYVQDVMFKQKLHPFERKIFCWKSFDPIFSIFFSHRHLALNDFLMGYSNKTGKLTWLFSSWFTDLRRVTHTLVTYVTNTQP